MMKGRDTHFNIWVEYFKLISRQSLAPRSWTENLDLERPDAHVKDDLLTRGCRVTNSNTSNTGDFLSFQKCMLRCGLHRQRSGPAQTSVVKNNRLSGLNGGYWPQRASMHRIQQILVLNSLTLSSISLYGCHFCLLSNVKTASNTYNTVCNYSQCARKFVTPQYLINCLVFTIDEHFKSLYYDLHKKVLRDTCLKKPFY